MSVRALDLDGLVSDASEASAAVKRERETAIRDTTQVIRRLESRVMGALDGDTLRGLSNLVPAAGQAFYGASILATKRQGIDTYLPEDGREALVLDKRGRLVMARREGGSWASRAARDAELHPQDLDAITRAVLVALERHIVRSERTAKSYRALSDLSSKLATAIGF